MFTQQEHFCDNRCAYTITILNQQYCIHFHNLTVCSSGNSLVLIASSWSLPSSTGEQAIVISTGEFGKHIFAYRRHWQIVTGPWLSEAREAAATPGKGEKANYSVCVENIDH